MPVFLLHVLVLAALLFYPVSRLVWVLSVRRLERRRGEPLTEGERAGQLRRARFIAVLVSLLFSFVYNAATLRVLDTGTG